MNVTARVRTWTGLSLLLCGIVIAGAVSFAIFADRVLTVKARDILQQSLAKTGLELKIGALRLTGWNGISGSNILLKDRRDGSVPLTVARVTIRFDFLAFLGNIRHPESALRRITLSQPEIFLKRFPDQTWNISRYFDGNQPPLVIRPRIQISRGALEIDDFQMGRHRLRQIDGVVNFGRLQTLDWNLKGEADLNPHLGWNFQGKMVINRSLGKGAIHLRRADAAKLVQFLSRIPVSPRTVDLPGRVSSGTADLQLNIFWNRSGLALADGKVALHDGVIVLPGRKPVTISGLEATFSPQRFHLQTARLQYGRSRLQATGSIDLVTKAVRGSLSANRLELAELTALLPRGWQTAPASVFAVGGWADARLTVAGTIRKPVVNGEADLTQASCEWRPKARARGAAEKIAGISGRMAVRDNLLTIQRLEGTWRGSLVGVTGRVHDIFHPRLDLRLFLRGRAAGLNELLNASAIPLRADGKINVTARVRGAWRHPRVNGGLNVERVQFQGQTVHQVQADLAWESSANRWQIGRLTGRIWDGRFASGGELQVLPDRLKWKMSGLVTGIQLQNLPLKPGFELAGSADANAVLDGVWRFDGTNNQCAALVSFQAKQLTGRGITVDEVSGIGHYRDGTLRIEALEAKIGKGRLFGTLLWQRDGIDAALDLREIPLQKIIADSRLFFQSKNAESFPVGGFFNGSLKAKGSIAHLTAQLTGECSAMTWRDQPLGKLSGGLTYAGNRITLQQVTAETGMGIVNIAGELILGSQATLHLVASSPELQLQGLAKWLPLDPRWNMAGTAMLQAEISGPLAQPVYRGALQALKPGIAEFQMERAELEFQGDATEIEIRRLQLFDQDTRVEMAGKINRRHWDLNVEGRAVNLNLLHLSSGAKTLTGTIDFKAHLTGGPAQPLLSAIVTGRDVSFGSWKYDRLGANLRWDGQGIIFDEANLTRADSTIEIHGRVIPAQLPQLDLELAVNACDVGDLLQFVPLPKEIVATGKASGLVTITGAINQPAVHFSGNLEDAVINSLAVTGFFDLFYQRDRVLIQKIELSHGKGMLSARGVWENRQTLKVQAKLMDFPIQALNAFFRQSFKVAGTVNSNLNLELSRDNVFGAYQVDIKDCAINGTQLEDLRAAGEFNRRGLTVDSGQLVLKGGLLTVNGSMPWPKELLARVQMPVAAETANALHLSLAFKNFPGRLLNGFQTQCTVTGGDLNGKVTVSGDLAAPVFNGEISGNNLQFRSEALPLPVEALQAAVTIRDNQARFHKATGNYGSGKFQVSGMISRMGRSDFEYTLALIGHKLYYKNTFFDGFGDVNLALNGTGAHSAVAGTITAYNGKVGVLGAAPSATEIKWDPDLDLKLLAGDNLRFRQPGLADITMKGDLQVRGSLSKPVLDGTLTSAQGVLTFYGRTFKVNRAKAVFSGSQGFVPYIEVESSLFTSTAAGLFNSGKTGEVEVEVFLDIKGQVGSERNFTVSLHSQPFLSQSKIYALLNWPDFTTWSNAGEPGGDQPLTVNGVVTGNISFITDTMFGDLFYELRRALNVDYLYLEQNYQTYDFRLNIGNKLNDRIFLSYSRSFTENPNDNLNINYSLNPNWNIGGTFNQDYGTSWRLLYQISF